MGFGPGCWRVSSRPWCGKTASCPGSTMALSRPCPSQACRTCALRRRGGQSRCWRPSTASWRGSW
eukprot:199503-Chlamydomonas_euryale.AAC.1